ncbi:UNVERIFIED_CONTAM: Ubiquitin-conjugating enzyme E2 Q2 [Gekko kuhli]
MSVSGLKAELKLLESIFGRDHERFRIVSWKLDELHCHFLLLPAPKTPDAPGPGRPPPPPPPLAIHCNITSKRSGGYGSQGELRVAGPVRPGWAYPGAGGWLPWATTE